MKTRLVWLSLAAVLIGASMWAVVIELPSWKLPTIKPVSTPPAEIPAPAPEVPASASEALEETPAELTPAQRAQNAYQEALPLIRNGRLKEAQALLLQTLALQAPHHEARQALVRMLLDAQQPTAAKTLLREGIQLAPEKTEFWMSLAHLQLQGNDIDGALDTLRKGLRHNTHQAPYQALLAAVLQSKGQHMEASERYQTALHVTPGNANWWVGLGVSLQALNKTAEAKSAYQRALELGVSAALSNEIQMRLTQINQNQP